MDDAMKEADDETALRLARGKRRRRDDGPSARDRILAAAERQFATAGVAATALREIAGESGVAINLISYHFRSKEELLEAVLERHAARITTLRQELLSDLELRYSPSPPPVREIVAALISPVFRMKEQDPDLWSNFVGLLNRERGSAAWSSTIGMRIGVMFKQHVTLLQRALPSTRRGDMVAAVAICFLSAMLSAPTEVRSIVGEELARDWDHEGLEQLLIEMMTAAIASLA